MRRFLLVFILSFLLPNLTQAATYDFGVVPQQSAQKLARLWTPILQYWSNQTGHEFRFKTAKNIPSFEERLAAGEYDFAYMNPYHYTVFSQTPGYRAIARESNKQIRGIIVVPKESKIETLAELAEQTLAFPSPAAFAASVLPRAKLSIEEISFSPKYVSSHDSVYLGVARGLYAAGGGVIRTFQNIDPGVRQQLRVLWKTDGYTPHAFAAHPEVPPEVSKQLVQVMQAMADDKQAKMLLKALKLKGLQAATDQDWDDVRGLGIDLLDQLIRG